MAKGRDLLGSMRKRRGDVRSALPQTADHSQMYIAGKAAIERRPITRGEYNRIRRQGMYAARDAAVWFIVALNFAAAAWAWESTRTLFLFLLGPLLVGALVAFIGARRFFSIAPNAAIYRFRNGREVVVPGYEVVKRGKAWRTYPTRPPFRLVADVPPSAKELLLEMEQERTIIAKRAITEPEREELGRPEPVTVMDCVTSFDFLSHLVFWAAIGWQAPAYGLIGIPLLIVLVFLKLRFPAGKHVGNIEITIKRDVVIDRKRVKWAEFLPDERVWTIEGEPADWRTR